MRSDPMIPRRAPFLAAALVAIGAASAAADPPREQREPPNLGVMSLESLDAPTHRETFSMSEYTPDPIEGFNRGSLAFTRPIIKEEVTPGRWAAMYLGLFGTYRKNEIVDIEYRLGGDVKLASDVDIEP